MIILTGTSFILNWHKRHRDSEVEPNKEIGRYLIQVKWLSFGKLEKITLPTNLSAKSFFSIT